MNAASTYAYRARDQHGQPVTGTLSAESPEKVASQLRVDGLVLTGLRDASASAQVQADVLLVQARQRARRVRRGDVVSMCQELGVMIESGVTLSEALSAVTAQAKRPEFRSVMASVTDEVCGGMPFSEALARRARIFPPVMVSLVRASEASGTMAEMLLRIAEYLGAEEKTARQVRGALIYPAFMFGTGAVVVLFMMIFILPRFAKIYEMRSASLPGPTRILMGLGEFVSTQWMYYLPAILVSTIILVLWQRSPQGTWVRDWLKLHVPGLRDVFRNLYLTRASRTMSTLLAAGVNLLDVIAICRSITGNRVFNRVWSDMETRVRDGLPLSTAFTESAEMPPNVSSMVTAGERSGRLPEVMEKVATFSQERLESSVKKATTMIEPIMIIGMGLLVGAVALALLLPIFKMGGVVAG
ncbi:MAG: type II secretion system F family protein [Planctomycetota bacterium]|nr:type II secretion system F family protein [Planctomycetota bacterium]